MLKTCNLHRITYNDRFDPTCPQCILQGTTAIQADAQPGKFGAPPAEVPNA